MKELIESDKSAEEITQSLVEGIDSSEWVESLVNFTNATKSKATGNERDAYEGTYKDASVRIADFGNWFTVNMAFGEVRNIWQNNTPMAEHGIVDAALYNTEDKVRVGGVYGKGRTAADFDEYIKPKSPKDFLEILHRYKGKLATGETGQGDLSSGSWDDAKKGWV